jgi:hypothetical protein
MPVFWNQKNCILKIRMSLFVLTLSDEPISVLVKKSVGGARGDGETIYLRKNDD